MPNIKVNTIKEEKIQPGWTLTNFSNRNLRVPITATVIDPRGNIRWFYQHGDAPDMRGDIDVRTDPEGILIGGTNLHEKEDLVRPALVGWNQKVLWKGKLGNHHHIHRRENGNFIFLVDESRDIGKNGVGRVVSCNIIEFDPEKNVKVWIWRLLDHVTPKVDRFDWAHCNTIEEGPEGNALYLSARNLNSIFKIDRNSGEIVWRLGEDGDFEMDKEDMFYHQHSPELQPNGNILIYDNGTGRPSGEYSRALELSIEENNMVAKSVWEWGKELDLFTPIWGDADRLENGNTLITFGTRTHPEQSRIIEVTDEGEVVWDVELSPPGWGMYRAERISSEITTSELPKPFEEHIMPGWD